MTDRAESRPPTGGLTKLKWWALVHHRRDLPVVFRTREEALQNREDDEYLVRVEIAEVRK